MTQDKQLMSQKEKDYIASCFNRTAMSLKTEISYEDVLNGEKITYDLKEGKRQFKMTFGKAYRRSRKHFRPSSNTENNFLKDSLMVTELFETLNILKYLQLDNDSLEEISTSTAIYFKSNFSGIINNVKTYKFIEQFFNIGSDDVKCIIMECFYKDHKAIKDIDLLFKFLDQNIKIIPIKKTFISKGLWASNTGCLLGLFLLLKDQSLLQHIYKAFMNARLINCEYLHKFLSVLASICNKTQKKEINEKLKKEGITNVNSLLGNMSLSNNQ